MMNPSAPPPQGGGRSAAMKALLSALGDQVSGFLVTPPGFDAPVGMINITPLPGDFDVHSALTPQPDALAAEPPLAGPPPAEAVVEVDEPDLDDNDDEEPDDEEPDDDVDDYGDDDDDDDL